MALLCEGEKKFDDIFSRFNTIPAYDRQASCNSIVRAMHNIAVWKFVRSQSSTSDKISCVCVKIYYNSFYNLLWHYDIVQLSRDAASKHAVSPEYWINDDVLRRTQFAVNDRFPYTSTNGQRYDSNDFVESICPIEVLCNPVNCHAVYLQSQSAVLSTA